MEKAQSFLAIDLGVESGWAVLGHLHAGKLELQEIHRFPNRPVQVVDSLYWDVLHLWDEMQHGLALAVKESEKMMVSLGVDTWGWILPSWMQTSL